MIFLHLALGANLGEEVGAEDADGEDDHNEGDNEVDEGGECSANLEGDASNSHLRLRDSLAGGEGGRENGGNKTLRDGGEELGNDTAEVDRRRDDDDILGVQHLFV